MEVGRATVKNSVQLTKIDDVQELCTDFVTPEGSKEGINDEECYSMYERRYEHKRLKDALFVFFHSTAAPSGRQQKIAQNIKECYSMFERGYDIRD